MSLRALETAKLRQSILPRALVSDGRSIQRGHSSVFFRDCIHQGVAAICNADTPVHEQFEAALLVACGLTELHREMALRGLKAYLFGTIDRQSEERVLGAFDRSVMLEMFEDNEVDMKTFELIQASWEAFEFPTNGGRFAPISECFILGEFPMEAITPMLPKFDKKTQEDVLTPVTWVEYAESFLNRDQAGDESYEHDLKVKHVLADIINNVKRKNAA
jgi:hypothetical protein